MTAQGNQHDNQQVMGKPKPIKGLAPKRDEIIRYNQAHGHDETRDSSRL
jgi:hypothetical protein